MHAIEQQHIEYTETPVEKREAMSPLFMVALILFIMLATRESKE